MAIFLDLGRQGAAASHLDGRVVELHHQPRQDGGHAIPFDRRIAPRPSWIKQLAVLDEEEGSNHQRRDRLEAGVDAMRVPGGKAHLAVAVQQRQPRLGLLPINRKAAIVDQGPMPRRQPCLVLDREAPLAEAIDEVGQIDIAEARIMRPVLGKADVGARSLVQLEAEFPPQSAHQLRLEPRGSHFGGGSGGQEDAGGQHQPRGRGASPRPVWRFHDLDRCSVVVKGIITNFARSIESISNWSYPVIHGPAPGRTHAKLAHHIGRPRPSSRGTDRELCLAE